MSESSVQILLELWQLGPCPGSLFYTHCLVMQNLSLTASANFGWRYSCSTHRIKRSINSDRFLHITYLNMKDTKIKSGRIINIMHTLHRLKAISCHTLKAVSCYNQISI